MAADEQMRSTPQDEAIEAITTYMHAVDIRNKKARIFLARWLETERKYYDCFYPQHHIVERALEGADPMYRDWLSRASRRRERFKMLGTRHADFIDTFSRVPYCCAHANGIPTRTPHKMERAASATKRVKDIGSQ